MSLDKEEKIKETKDYLQKKDVCPIPQINTEVQYYFNDFGLPDSYFSSYSAAQIGDHILCIYTAKIIATLNNSAFSIDVKSEEENSALYICNAESNSDDLSPHYQVEKRIEFRYLKQSKDWEEYIRVFGDGQRRMFEKAAKHKKTLGVQKQSDTNSAQFDTYRIEAYRTKSSVSPKIPVHLWYYFVTKATYPTPNPPPAVDPIEEKEVDIQAITNEDFKNKKMIDETKSEYLQLIQKAAKQVGPVMQIVPFSRETVKLLVCFRTKSDNSQGFFSALTNLIRDHRLDSTKKFLEPFHGFSIISIHINIDNRPEDWKEAFLNECSTLFSVPVNYFSFLFHYQTLSVDECAYCYCAALFIFYFCGTNTPQTESEYKYLESHLHDPSSISKLQTIIRSHILTTWSEVRIRESLIQNPTVVKLLFQHFSMLNPTSGKRPISASAAATQELSIKEEMNKIQNEFDRRVLSACIQFNHATIKTNLLRKQKSSLVFDIDPEITTNDLRRYPVKPYSIFLIIGSNFRGFHIRFTDIARGGVRIVVSNSVSEYTRNAAEAFFENYSLAYTQQKKNKDIPEGGSKGVILCHPRLTPEEYGRAFHNYIDGILDMLVPDYDVPTEIKNRDPKPFGKDIVFVGPDERTADLMDWACLYAKRRGNPIWKAFTTGKSPSLGGIPHDKFGMTTDGVHQYVLGALDKMGLKEEQVTKCQTGGPDGDLGSNEILISKDKTVAIIDGSGVLYDPVGLDRSELVRLATNRLMVHKFDKSKLSDKGFLILVADKNVTLPDGSIVEDGLRFRNLFHLHPLFTADVFVPCGGRPEAVNMSNVDIFAKVAAADGTHKKRFSLIVEGANLFISQDARLRLEGEGVVLFKDACANKGGVTSSSCEVLVALAMNDEEFSSKMCSKSEAETPEYYTNYAQQVLLKIESNARREFDCLWKENQKSRIPISVLVDTLSLKINELGTSIRASPLLWNDINLRNGVLRMAIPPLMINTIGLSVILERVPEAYCKWIFAAYLASDYVYTHGYDTTEFTFMTYVNTIRVREKALTNTN